MWLIEVESGRVRAECGRVVESRFEPGLSVVD